MKTGIKNKSVISRKNKLDEITVKLKTEFVGLDHIIDCIMPLLAAWYTFPEAQGRPCIINLWGLTGSGKTALVKRLVALLRWGNLFAHFDMGEFDSDSSKSFREVLSKHLKYLDGQRAIICLDEFQFARTIVRGYEVNKDKLRVMWELLDSGIISWYDENGTSWRRKPKQIDLSRSLIFVIGNLDEAYKMNSELDADADADYMHEQTAKITVAQVKDALTKRFRSEQIARLGNNHFLYRSFTVEQFRRLIQQELARLVRFADEKFSFTIHFDQSVADIVYAEGVVPSQGVRPLLTTIHNMIQSRLARVRYLAAQCSQEIRAVDWSYSERGFVYAFKDATGFPVMMTTETIVLITESRRKSVAPRVQAQIAVHESGHAVLAALLLRIVPSLVVSRTASFRSEGFCRVRFPERSMTRDSLMKDITLTLGGLAAEKLIFGDDLTGAGVSSDLENASQLANDAIRRYGMGKDPVRLAVVRESWTEDYFTNSDPYENESLELVRACMNQALAVLDKNKLLLLKMSEYLTYHSKMDQAMIEEFVKKYSVEEWVRTSGFIEPENYYKFDEMVKSQLQELELAESSVENLVLETLAQ